MDYRRQVENLSLTAGIVLRLLKVLGMLICVMIVVMMSGMIVEESRRNISMLGVLGYLTAYSMILAAAQSSGMIMSLPVKAVTILSSFLFVAVAYLLAMLLSGRKLRKVDMVESLKCARSKR